MSLILDWRDVGIGLIFTKPRFIEQPSELVGDKTRLLTQPLTGLPITIALEIGVPLFEQLLRLGIGTNLPAAVAAPMPRPRGLRRIDADHSQQTHACHGRSLHQ